MTARDNARILANSTKLSVDWDHYKALRNKCNMLSKKDKTSHFEKLFNENESVSNLYKKVKKSTGMDICWSPTVSVSQWCDCELVPGNS